MRYCQGFEQSAGAFGIVIAAREGLDIVSDMAQVEFDIWRVTDPQADPAGDLEGRGATLLSIGPPWDG